MRAAMRKCSILVKFVPRFRRHHFARPSQCRPFSGHSQTVINWVVPSMDVKLKVVGRSTMAVVRLLYAAIFLGELHSSLQELLEGNNTKNSVICNCIQWLLIAPKRSGLSSQMPSCALIVVLWKYQIFWKTATTHNGRSHQSARIF